MAYIGKSPTGNGVRSRYYYTATGGETSLSGTDDNGLTLVFSDGNYVDVSLNGIALVAGTDYNTSTANTIAGLSALSASDIVEIVVYDIFTVADTVSAKDGGTFSGNVAMGGTLSVTGASTLAGDLTVDTSTLKVDSTNNRVGIGTTSPSYLTEIAGNGGGDTVTLALTNAGSDPARLRLNSGHGNWSVGNSITVGDALEFRDESASSTRMLIDGNGTLIVNDTSRILGCPMHLTYDGANEQGICIENIANSSAGAAIRFIDHTGSFTSGGIYFSASNNISYSTTSDYRLKENVTADWDATTRLKQLNPVRFNFISDAATTFDGFLAHEVQTVVPEAIIGTHNAVETWTQRQIDNGEAPDGTSAGDNKLDDDGNTIPVYQGIDMSKMVPLLVKTIQELEARITALENVE